MSNAPNKEQNVKIEQTENQRDPGRARAEDFEVRKYAPTPTAFHGQRGDSKSEESRLLNERFQGRPQQPTRQRNIAGGK